jgi:hypothetical protein
MVAIMPGKSRYKTDGRGVTSRKFPSTDQLANLETWPDTFLRKISIISWASHIAPVKKLSESRSNPDILFFPHSELFFGKKVPWPVPVC